ncbi:Fe(3+) ABC transporter substrate-binding protein [Verrucomicrobium sp. BvORR106]|uniref:Fe(3+) ABC transporter substrate-binding protein n=1 Tax=Verrucomicrobium sp. BvORR106 TaxID=1403819 RepID=UPI0005714910|nr:Fe(3+) ABC transporter substrate-binding protein [Verrucomicrobium sp. BvORR106]
MRTNLNKPRTGLRSWLLVTGLAFLGGTLLSAKELNVYTHRHYKADEEINALFTERTGIKVNVVSAEADQLIERLKSEGANSPADLLVTVDAGRLQRAKEAGLLKPLKSEVLEQRVPAALRDSGGHWYAYALRARVILYAQDRVKPGEISNYEDLADPKWRGRLLIRSSGNAYNQSLLASLIAADGEEKAEAWAKGVVANLARPPQGGDRDQIKGVASGLADVCVSNTYYLGMLLNSKDPAEQAAAKKVTVLFPNQSGRGTHANIAGAGLTVHAKNAENAKAYLEFLTTPEVQKLIANGTYEFPVNRDLSLSETHKAWGEFKLDEVTFPQIGRYQEQAVRLFDKAGWK